MKESDILYERGDFWVLDKPNAYLVMHAGITASTSESAYERTPDGFSIACARVNYLTKRAEDRRQKPARQAA